MADNTFGKFGGNAKPIASTPSNFNQINNMKPNPANIGNFNPANNMRPNLPNFNLANNIRSTNPINPNLNNIGMNRQIPITVPNNQANFRPSPTPNFNPANIAKPTSNLRPSNPTNNNLANQGNNRQMSLAIPNKPNNLIPRNNINPNFSNQGMNRQIPITVPNNQGNFRPSNPMNPNINNFGNNRQMSISIPNPNNFRPVNQMPRSTVSFVPMAPDPFFSVIPMFPQPNMNGFVQPNLNGFGQPNMNGFPLNPINGFPTGPMNPFPSNPMNVFPQNANQNELSDYANTGIQISPDIKPWYKKKATIIAMSSALGIGALTTAIVLPIALIGVNVQNAIAFNNAIVVYDLANDSVKLAVEGNNLPDDKTLYSVLKKNVVDFEPVTSPIVFNWNSGSEVNLIFTDIPFDKSSVYQVILNNGTGGVVKVSTNPIGSTVLPMLSITQQPQSQTVSSSNENVILNVGASITANAIAGSNIQYQWKVSNTASSNESDWTPIAGETSSTYTYNPINLNVNEEKFFKCTLSYKYVTPVDTQIVFVSRKSRPIINIATQPVSASISYLTSTTTISVSASVTNGVVGQELSYLWQISNSENGTWTPIANATSSTLTYAVTNSHTPGTKKYFRCILTYLGALEVISNVASVSRALQPAITINTQPSNVSLTHTQTDATLSVNASVVNSTSSLTYQWQSSSAANGTFSPINGQTSNIYNLTNVSFGFRQYYRCVISSVDGATITSNVVYITKVFKPALAITSQPTDIFNFGDGAGVTFSVDATVLNPINGLNLSYQWFISDNQTSGFTPISGATQRTYTYYQVSNMAVGSKKYFNCVVSYPSANPLTSRTAYIQKSPTPTISTVQPTSQTLTSSWTDFYLLVNATVNNPVNQGRLSYQWQSSNSQYGTYTSIPNEIGSRFDKTLDANKLSWQDTWYRCVISYPYAASITTNPALVKMTLTQAEAIGEYKKWFAVESNAKQILQGYFNNTQANPDRTSFYSKLLMHTLTTPPTSVSVESMIPITISASGTQPFPAYRIKLRLNSSATYSSVVSGAPAKVLPVGSFIEFVTLFSFQGRTELAWNVYNSANYVIDLALSSVVNNKTTGVYWNQTSAADTTPNDSKSLLSQGNSYPVTAYSSNGSIIFTDLLKTPAKPIFNSSEFPMLPSYNIV